MSDLATLRLAIDARKAKMGAAEFNQATDRCKRSAIEASNRITTGFSLAMKSILLFGGAGGAIYTLKRFVDSASDAQETMNKFNVVFGVNAREAAVWAETFGDKVGRATDEVQRWMSGLQDTFVPLGFTRDKAEELSKSLTELAVDVGSFQNMQTSDVIREFTSALVGNHEAVRNLGIIISESALKQEAYNQGLDKTYDQLTDLEKVQLRFNLIQKGSADAVGDIERSVSSYAYQVNELKANYREISITIGQQLIPSLTDLLKHINDLSKGGNLKATFHENIAVLYEFGDALTNLDELFVKINPQKWPKTYAEMAAEQRQLAREARGQFEGAGDFKMVGATPKTWQPGFLGFNETDYLNKRLQEAYGSPASSAAAPGLSEQHATKSLKDQEDFAKQAADITARMYEDMGVRGDKYFSSQKALLDIQRNEYEKFVDDKKLLDDWYYDQLEQISQEAYEKQKNSLDLYIEDLEARAGDIAGHFAQAAGDIEFSMANAFDSMIADGQSFKEAMNGFFKDVANAFSRMAAEMAAQYAMLAIFQGLSGIGGMFRGPNLSLTGPTNAGVPPVLGHGGVLSGGRIMPMANGMVLDRPTYFPMANGNVGLAGEAGPELGFFPLKRQGGRLGIEASGQQQQPIHNEVRVRLVVVDDKRKAAIEALQTEEGEKAVITALSNSGLI